MAKQLPARWLAILFFFVLIGVTLSQPGSAEAIQAGNLPVDIKPIYPTRQVNQKLGYFVVSLKSGEATDFKLQLKNLSAKPQTVVIRPIIATTTAQGSVNYQPVNEPKDSSIQLDYGKLIGPTRHVRLQGQATEIITFNFKVPTRSTFKGTVLGSLYVYSPTNNTQNKKAQKPKKNHIQFINNFAIYVGVEANINDYTRVKPAFRLRKVQPQLMGISPVAMIQLQNYHPAFIPNHGLVLAAKMYHQGSRKILVQTKLPTASFAPNSTMYLPLKWPLGKLSAGQYTVKVDLVYNSQKWHLVRNFTVTGQQVDKLQQQLSPKKTYSWLWIFLAILIVLINLFFMVLMYTSGKRRANEAKQKPTNTGKRTR